MQERKKQLEMDLELELYAEELPDLTQYSAAGTSTVFTESTALSGSCPTSSASTYSSASSFSW